ncbi:hypothetical protein, partial [Kitasatospora sp. SC0581]
AIEESLGDLLGGGGKLTPSETRNVLKALYDSGVIDSTLTDYGYVSGKSSAKEGVQFIDSRLRGDDQQPATTSTDTDADAATDSDADADRTSEPPESQDSGDRM